jgi:hypothetical protein
VFYTFIVYVTSKGFVTQEAEEQFGVGTEVSILGQSLFNGGLVRSWSTYFWTPLPLSF